MERYSTIDEITGEIIPYNFSESVLIDYINDIPIFGYVSRNSIKNHELISVCEGRFHGYCLVKNFEKYKIFSKSLGRNFIGIGLSTSEKIQHQYVKTSGYPYTFYKEYEAVKNFDIFNGKQIIRKPIVEFPLDRYLKYTFGLEFETSTGIIPEQTCFEDGLIPLRDGSIDGNEYSTVILEGRIGLNLLKQQLEDLRYFTRFDKECSLHIHLGGYPLVPDRIFALYKVCKSLEGELSTMLPRYTFKTSSYKKSGKDYCKLLPTCSSFDSLYTYLVQKPFFGSLFESHPQDIDRERKWNIHQRYHWLNLINMVCYNVNKTVEFRLLRPTYNLEKILFWLYVFNGILAYCEINDQPKSILDIMKEVYPKEIFETLEEEYYKVYWCTRTQHQLEDYIGSKIDIENEFFESDKII